MRKIIMTGLIIVPLVAFGENSEQLNVLSENQLIPVDINTEGKLKAFFDFKKSNIAPFFHPKKINTDASKIEALKGTWNLAFKIEEKAYTEKLEIDLSIDNKGEIIGIGENSNADFLVCFYNPELFSILDSDYQCGASTTLSSGEIFYENFSLKFSGNSITGGYYGIGKTIPEANSVQKLKLYPITGYRQYPQPIKNAEYDSITKILDIQDVQVGTQHYQVTLQSNGNDLFSLKSAQPLITSVSSIPAKYENSKLTLFIPKVKAFGTYYQVEFKNIGNNVFQLNKVNNYY